MDQFRTIATLLESVVGSKTVQAKEAQFRKFFCDLENYRRQRTAVAEGDDQSTTLYPVLRLLLPGLDRERKAYGIREKTLANAYVRALALERNNKDCDAARLLSSRAGGDLADRLVPLLRGRCPAQSALTVDEVNRRLDALADGSGMGVQTDLSYLIEHGTPSDHRWLVRIILRNLRLGHLSSRRVLQLYHPSGPTLYDSTGDLRYVVQLLEQAADGDAAAVSRVGASKLLATEETSAFVQLGKFVRPMLCQRVELHKVNELLARHTFWLETKMDGERFQLHKDGASFRYLSRNGVDYSATFGLTADQIDGTLTPMLAQLIAESVHSTILDGEMMVFDRRTLQYQSKCDGGADVKAMRPGNGELRACFCVYDVLLLNGRALTDMPYAERAHLLRTVLVREQLGFLQLCRREKVRDPVHLVELLNDAIDTQQEGVVLKREDAPYQPNRRAGGGWYKIKPDYIAGLVTDFDLVVLGGYFNARRTYVNVFVVGVVTKSADGKMRFLPVVKVSMGLSTAQWSELNRSLRPHWQETSKTVAPTAKGERAEASAVCWGRSGPPDVCIEPTASIVLQLKGSELVRSDTYAAGYTIRFPRIVAIRSDKMPDEVCTLAELEQLASGSGPIGATSKSASSQSVLGGDVSRKATKLAKRHVTLEDLSHDPAPAGSTNARKSALARTRAAETVLYDASNQPLRREGILGNRDICVMGSFAGAATIRELEGLVWQHGVRAVANPGPNTFAIVVVGPETFKVRKYSATGRWDVLRSDWLLRAAAQPSQLEPFRPSDMLASTEETRLALTEAYDRYGDSYTRPVTPTSFTNLLRHGANGMWSGARLTAHELVLSERTLFGATNQSNYRRLFRGLSARLYLPTATERAENEPEDETECEWLVDKLRAQREMLYFVHSGGRWPRDTEAESVAYVFTTASADVPSALRWVQSLERTCAAREGNHLVQNRKTTTETGEVAQQDRPVALRIEWVGKSLEKGQLCDVADFALS